MTVNVTVLGCGTSGGVPRIGNVWGDCDPNEPRNRRRRVSILVKTGSAKILVDTTPDLRDQALDAGIEQLDAVLFTHDHADHTHGIDDLRGFFVQTGERVPIYATASTLQTLRTRFGYIFDSVAGYPSVCQPHEIDGRFQSGPIHVAGVQIQPFEQFHGHINSVGYRFGPFAYSTDVKALDEDAFAALAGVDTWLVAALRPKPHPTHAHLDLVLSWIERVKPRRAILTHMTHEMDYATLCKSLPKGVEPAYDGMEITVSAVHDGNPGGAPFSS